MKNSIYCLVVILYVSCDVSETKKADIKDSVKVDSALSKLKIEQKQEVVQEIQEQPNDTSFVNIRDYSEDFAFDMRYATANNFLKEVVYDCDNCLMRYEVAKALIKANDSLMKRGYKIKFFDCFRPVEVQHKMWKIYPDARYVANPNTSGSVHNKGAALDITLVTMEGGEEVNMGTGFDHFGEEAHHAYADLPEKVLNNRKTLKGVMESFGFNAIRTEWWHYNFPGKIKYLISDQPLCE